MAELKVMDISNGMMVNYLRVNGNKEKKMGTVNGMAKVTAIKDNGKMVGLTAKAPILIKRVRKMNENKKCIIYLTMKGDIIF